MREHTSKKSCYAVAVGKWVFFYARPPLGKGQKYREPVKVKEKYINRKADRERAIKEWEA